MDQLLQEAEESLDRVLKFYQSVGTSLSYRPTIEFSNDPRELINQAYAEVHGETELVARSFNSAFESIAPYIWEVEYGLKISKEAIDEAVFISQKTIEQLLNETETTEKNDCADIIIFPRYRELNKNQREILLAHEVWHLIEIERNIYQKNIIINEGTATFVQNHFVGKKCDVPIEQFNEFLPRLYRGVANIVQNHVGSLENPYTAILNPKIRKNIESETIERMKPLIITIFDEMRKSEQYRELLNTTTKENPFFSKMNGKATAKKIIEAYSNFGAVKMAQELEKQDLSKLIESFNLLI